MPATIESQTDPRDRTRVGFRITGDSFAEVQSAIEGIQRSPAIGRADFTIPQHDGIGFIAVGQALRFRAIPEVRSLKVIDALTTAAQTAIDPSRPLTAEERACRAMKSTADLFDALARDTQDMIDRCRDLTITHEALIERLTFRLSIEKQTAKMLRDDEG
jgi:hypothetical protein